MKVQIINKHSKRNIHVGMAVGKFGEKVVAKEPLQIEWKNSQPTVWCAENNFCAEVSDDHIKAVKKYFKENLGEYFSLKITDRKTFDNENTKEMTYKGVDAGTLCGHARDFSCTFSQIEEVLGAFQVGRLNTQDKKTVENVKRLMKIVFEMNQTLNIGVGEDSNGNCLYDLSQK